MKYVVELDVLVFKLQTGTLLASVYLKAMTNQECFTYLQFMVAPAEVNKTKTSLNLKIGPLRDKVFHFL